MDHHFLIVFTNKYIVYFLVCKRKIKVKMEASPDNSDGDASVLSFTGFDQSSSNSLEGWILSTWATLNRVSSETPRIVPVPST